MNLKWKETGVSTTVKGNNEITTIYSKSELFNLHAPDFNFELDEDQLLNKALEMGFVVEIGEDQYKQNNNYWEGKTTPHNEVRIYKVKR